MKISVIIPSYNGLAFLKDCLSSIMQQTFKNIEIIVVDNASTDESLNFIKNSFPKVRIIKNKTNMGFSIANNIGVKNAGGEIILFLNNDTFLEKDTLEKLLIYKKNNSLNILGPKILNYKEKEIHIGYKCTIDCTGYIGSGKKTFYIDGCALMINRDDFLKLGGFDEKYFMYSEDIDLCWRAHLYGMKIGVCKDAIVKHFGGGTGGYTQYEKHIKREIPVARRYEVEKNNLRNVLKNYSFINLLWVIPLFEIQSLIESFFYLFSGNFSACRAVWNANLWNLKNINNSFAQRKIIQKKRVLGDLQILSMMNFGLNKFRALKTIGIPKYN